MKPPKALIVVATILAAVVPTLAVLAFCLVIL
jgi:hypothetical protein